MSNEPDDPLERRLAFLDLDEVDRQRLQELAPLYQRHAAAFVEAFYQHLLRFDETAAFLRDPALVEHLKITQNEHFRSMLEARWDADYVRQRHRVGRMHADVGIDPQWFLGAYNQYVQFWFRRYVEAAGSTDQEGFERILSVLKVIFLDVGLTLDAYFAQATQKLRHALDMLWKANVELKHFAHLASHDLKTPLATVANLCDEALDEFGEAMPRGARQLIEAALARTFRMSQMIDDLLTSHVSAPETEANDAVSSEAALKEAADRLRPILDQRRVALRLPSGAPLVWGNRVRLQEAFYNLLSNAAKFVPEGTGRIEVTVQPEQAGYRFTIADNGPGIPADELDRIFLPFRRLPQHRNLPGSGLGLYFAKNLIEHQQGKVWAESASGHGSRFHVWLPSPRQG
jgi:signal transduction histidine kinase